MMKPKISIIIIVKNDRGIADTLAALARQERLAATETIVVDASKPSFLADIRALHPEVHWHQFISNSGRKTSIPEQRNFAIRQAAGEIIVFIDANCIPSKHWLIDLTTPILKGHEMMVGGSIRTRAPELQVDQYIPDEIGGYLSVCPTMNLAFKRIVWEKVGKFDESFLYGSDADFTWRCIAAGYKIKFISQAVVTHDWGTAKDEIKRSFNYGKGRAMLYYKHPHYLNELFSKRFYVAAYTGYFLLMPLTFYIPWYPLIIFIPFVKNIKKKPFKTIFTNMIYTFGMWTGFGVLFAKGRYS